MNGNLMNKIIGHTSYILKTINQIIPIYEDINPLIKKLGSLKNIFKTDKIALEKQIKKEEDHEIKSSSNPQFFL